MSLIENYKSLANDNKFLIWCPHAGCRHNFVIAEQKRCPLCQERLDEVAWEIERVQDYQHDLAQARARFEREKKILENFTIGGLIITGIPWMVYLWFGTCLLPEGMTRWSFPIVFMFLIIWYLILWYSTKLILSLFRQRYQDLETMLKETNALSLGLKITYRRLRKRSDHTPKIADMRGTIDDWPLYVLVDENEEDREPWQFPS